MIFKYELYKLLIKRKVLIIVVAAIIIKVLLLMSEYDIQINQKMENYKKGYNMYLNNVGMYITPETERYIVNEKKRINNIKEEYNRALYSLTKGMINETDFLIVSKQNKDILSVENAFNVFLSEYEYVKLDPERRCFLYTNGWCAMLGSEKLDVLLITILMFISISIFDQEYDTDMYYILKTCKNGRSKLFYAKLKLSMIISLLLSVFFLITELFFYKIKYGLPSIEAHIQSLSQFSDSSYNISLSLLTMIVFLCKIWAAEYLTIIIVWGITSFKKVSAVLLLVFTICVLPYFIFEKSIIRYIIPSPLGFFLSIGYCQATIKDKLNNDVTINIASYQSIIVFIISAMIMIILFFLSYREYCRLERSI